MKSFFQIWIVASVLFLPVFRAFAGDDFGDRNTKDELAEDDFDWDGFLERLDQEAEVTFPDFTNQELPSLASNPNALRGFKQTEPETHNYQLAEDDAYALNSHRPNAVPEATLHGIPQNNLIYTTQAGSDLFVAPNPILTTLLPVGQQSLLRFSCRGESLAQPRGLDEQLYDIIFGELLDLKKARSLLLQGANPNLFAEDDGQGFWKGCHALAFAAYRGNLELLQLLIEYGANVNLQTNTVFGFTALHAAIQSVCSSRVQLCMIGALLALGANKDVLSGDGLSPLAYAVQAGSVEIVQFLIKQGANVDAASEPSKRPIFYALNKGHAELVALLVKETMEPIGGLIEVVLNAQQFRIDTKMLLLSSLLQCNIDLILSRSIEVGIHKNALAALLRLFVFDDSLESLSSLITRELLEVAIDRNNPEILGFLLGCLRHLVRANVPLANIGFNRMSPNGGTLLSRALKTKNLAVFKVLLESGFVFNLSLCYDSGKTLAQVAEMQGLVGIANYLKTRHRDQTVALASERIKYAIKNSRVDLMEDVLSYLVALRAQGIDVSLALAESDVFFHVLKMGSLDVLKMLIELSTDFDIDKRYDGGMTLLHIAYQWGLDAIALYLIDSGANRHMKDDWGTVPDGYCLDANLFLPPFL